MQITGLKLGCEFYVGCILTLGWVSFSGAAESPKESGISPSAKAAEPFQWTSREKGSVPWADVRRAPEQFVDQLVTLECTELALSERGVSTGKVAAALTNELGSYAFRLGGDEGVELLASGRIALPASASRLKLTGLWSRADEHWRSRVTSNGPVFGLRVASFSTANTNEVITAYPALSPWNQPVNVLKERAQRLLDALTQFQRAVALQRYQKNFPPPANEPYPLAPDLEKLLNDSAPSRDGSDMQLARQFRDLVRALEAAASRLGDMDERTFLAERARAISESIALLQDLCEGRFRGRIEAEQFRAWLVNRMVLLGDLVEARSAMGSGEVPSALDSTGGRTVALLRNLGEVLPDCRFTTDDGSTISSGSFRGKWTVIYFKRTEGPSRWRKFYTNFTNQLASIEAGGELNLASVIVPLNRNRDATWVRLLRVLSEPQILVISPEGRLAYFNEPLRPAIPEDYVFRAWILGGPGRVSRAERVLQILGEETP